MVFQTMSTITFSEMKGSEHLCLQDLFETTSALNMLHLLQFKTINVHVILVNKSIMS